MAVRSQKPIKLAVPSFIPGQAYPVTILEPHWVLTTAPKKARDKTKAPAASNGNDLSGEDALR